MASALAPGDDRESAGDVAGDGCAEDEEDPEALEEAAADADVGGGRHDPSELPPSELKQQGNEAYRLGEYKAALGFWNRALRAHIDLMKAGVPLGSSASPLSPESRDLERSLYLNLAQGYLKTGEPGRALRACQVVTLEHRDDAKAKYRAAEACLALGRLEEARAWLEGLEPLPPEGAALMSRISAGLKVEARRQREAAKRMLSAAGGLAEERAAAAPRGARAAASRRSTAEGIAAMDPAALASGVDIAEEAAMAARTRRTRLDNVAAAALESGPQPTTGETDLDAFRARILAKSNKYAASTEKYRKRRDSAQHSVKLSWLRGGREAAQFDGFAARWHEELREAEADDVARAAGGDADGADGGGGVGSGGGASASGVVGQAPAPLRVEEMD